MRRRGGDRLRRWAVGGLLVTASAMAAGGAFGLSQGARSAGDQAVAQFERVPGHPHAATAEEARRDRRRALRCARPAYRRAHRASCPSPLGAPASGVSLKAAPQDALEGSWGAPFTIASWPINQVLLPTGKVLWITKGDTEGEGGRAYVWDPERRTTRSVPPPSVPYPDGVERPANLFCSGHAQLADGRILVAGGNLAYPDPAGGPASGFKGGRWVMIFDPFTETWSRQPDMSDGRWYPTVTTLPDGRALIVGGWDASGEETNNAAIELFTPAARPGERGALTEVARRATSLYPRVVVVPDRSAAGAPAGTQVLIAGPSQRDTGILSTADWRFTDVPDLPTSRDWGTAVLLPGGVTGPRELMVIGGYDPGVTPASQRTSVVLDLDRVSAGWRPGPPLANGRSHANTVLLPDGSMLAVGGGGGIGSDGGRGSSLYVGPVYAAERFDPRTGAWSPAGVQADERTYHSTALLLPDATVLSAGDDRSSHYAPAARTAEIYAPAYRFSGEPPTLGAAPEAVPYGAEFVVATPRPTDIDRAVLVRPGSVTHSNDMEQRVVPLALSASADGLRLTAPPDASVAPPGYYMLFLIDAGGRPSRARFVRLDPRAPAAPPVGGAPAPEPAPVGGAPAPPTAPPAAPAAAPSATGSPPAVPGVAAPSPSPGTRALPTRLRVVGARARVRAGRLHIVLRVSGPAGRTVRALVGGPGARAASAAVTLRGAAPGALTLSVPAPRGRRALSLPLALTMAGGARTESVRGRLVVERGPRVIVRLRP